jgi:hypothetical protein
VVSRRRQACETEAYLNHFVQTPRSRTSISTNFRLNPYDAINDERKMQRRTNSPCIPEDALRNQALSFFERQQHPLPLQCAEQRRRVLGS